MEMADVEDGGLEFLSDPIDRFPLPDLAAVEASQLPCSPVARSSNSAVGDGALLGEEACESGQKRISLQNSELPAHNQHEQATETANRFHLPDFTTSRSLLDREPIQTLVCTAAESSIDDVGDVPPAIQGDANSTCNGITLSVPNSEQSTGKANPEAPGWTYTNIHMSTWL